jgi:hypothetical protein
LLELGAAQHPLERRARQDLSQELLGSRALECRGCGLVNVDALEEDVRNPLGYSMLHQGLGYRFGQRPAEHALDRPFQRRSRDSAHRA